MTQTLILSALISAALVLGTAVVRKLFSRLLDWNLRRQFFVAGSMEPTSIVDYLIERERFRANLRKHPAYARAVERQQQAARARADSLPDA